MAPKLRTCLGCRARGSKSELIRLVWDPGAAAVVADVRQAMPGRGCYLHAGCAGSLITGARIGKALRRAVDPAQLARLLPSLAGGADSVRARVGR